MTIEQYARSETLVVGDWMVRMIVNKLSNIERQPLVPEDLAFAKELLREKMFNRFTIPYGGIYGTV